MTIRSLPLFRSRRRGVRLKRRLTASASAAPSPSRARSLCTQCLCAVLVVREARTYVRSVAARRSRFQKTVTRGTHAESNIFHGLLRVLHRSYHILGLLPARKLPDCASLRANVLTSLRRQSGHSPWSPEQTDRHRARNAAASAARCHTRGRRDNCTRVLALCELFVTILHCPSCTRRRYGDHPGEPYST